MDISIVQDAIKPFIEAGIVPENCTRLVIEMDVGGVVCIHYSCFGKRSIQDTLARLIAEGKITRDMAKKEDQAG